MADDPRRRLPSVSSLLQRERVRAMVASHGHGSVVSAARSVLAELRDVGPARGHVPPDEVAALVVERLRAGDDDRLRRVVNATGVVLHTNLGRAPLSEDAVAAVVDAAGPTTVEYDLRGARRASRGAHVGRLLRDLVAAEDALVVNNGAAGLVLALAVVASGRRVAVSRGELVEIGGSFRLPEIIEAAGVGLVEVGTTNRTRADDYRRALEDDDVVAILRVHPSNFRIEGFSSRPAASELADVARQRGVPFLHDVGSGLLHDDLPAPGGAGGEPSMRAAVADGADLVVASGDKLLGGPQAGLLAGSADLVDRCRRHPLARALRVDKLRLAALGVTLEAYRRDASLDLPVWRMLAMRPDDLRPRADRLRDAAVAAGLEADVVDVEGAVGGGSLPGLALPSIAVAIPDPAEAVAAALAAGDPPVVGRHRDGRLLLDLRTVPVGADDELAAAVRRSARRPPAGRRP